MTAEPKSIVNKPHVRVYLDGGPQPIIDRELPADITLDTRNLADGLHRLVIRAEGQDGREGVEDGPGPLFS